MTEVAGQGVGARVRRKEDSRFLRGRGSYVSDMVLPGQSEVAFLRSPIAHGRIRRIVEAAGQRRARVHPVGPPRGGRHDRADHGARLQALRMASAGARQGALRRRSGRDVRRADARRSRRSDGRDRGRVRRASRAGRRACRARREKRPRARAMERQFVPDAQPRQRLRRQRQGRAGRGQARTVAQPPGHGADGGQGDPGPLGRAQRPARRLLFDAGAACRPRRPCAVPRHRPGAGCG